MAPTPPSPQDFQVPFTATAPYFDGVYLAVGVIPDAYLVYQAHNCGYTKAARISSGHDLLSTLLEWRKTKRVVRSNLENREFIMGGAGKLSGRIREVLDKRNPGVVFVAGSNITNISGEDLDSVVRDMQGKTDVPVAFLPTTHMDEDYVRGYFDVLTALVSRLPLNVKAQETPSVAVIGHFFDRLEADAQGDVDEMRRMLGALGVRDAAFYPDGATFRKMAQHPAPSHVIDLAPQAGAGRLLATRAGADYLAAPLPLGIRATSDWVTQAGAFLGREEAAREFLDAELDRLVNRLEWLLPRYTFGRRTALFAHPFDRGAWIAFLEEIGCIIAGLGDLSGGEAPAVAQPDPAYPSYPVHAGPLRTQIDAEWRRGDLGLVIGNGVVGHVLGECGAPFVETGYPCHVHHVLYPAPRLGYGGVLRTLERIIQAVEESDRRKG